MKSSFLRALAILGMLTAGLIWTNPAAAATPMTSCTMTFTMSGFSLVYKQYSGTGNVSCRNGQRAQVALASKSLGFTIGKSEIEGTGVFTSVKNINEIYGDYMALDAHAGLTASVDGQVLTCGEISLVLSGKGRGIDIGVAIGALTISPKL